MTLKVIVLRIELADEALDPNQSEVFCMGGLQVRTPFDLLSLAWADYFVPYIDRFGAEHGVKKTSKKCRQTTKKKKKIQPNISPLQKSQ